MACILSCRVVLALARVLSRYCHLQSHERGDITGDTLRLAVQLTGMLEMGFHSATLASPHSMPLSTQQLTPSPLTHTPPPLTLHVPVTAVPSHDWVVKVRQHLTTTVNGNTIQLCDHVPPPSPIRVGSQVPCGRGAKEIGLPNNLRLVRMDYPGYQFWIQLNREGGQGEESTVTTDDSRCCKPSPPKTD